MQNIAAKIQKILLINELCELNKFVLSNNLIYLLCNKIDRDYLEFR